MAEESKDFRLRFNKSLTRLPFYDTSISEVRAVLFERLIRFSFINQ